MSKKATGLDKSREYFANIRTEDASARYQPLGLSYNPFPTGGAAPSNPQVEIYQEVSEVLHPLLKSFLESKKSNGIVILGRYGAGKTYHLNYIRMMLENTNMQMKIVSATEPGLHPFHVIRSTLLEIGEESIASMIWCIIRPVLQIKNTENPKFFEGFAKPKVTKNSPSPQMALRMGIEKITEHEWSDHRLFFSVLDRSYSLDRDKLLEFVSKLLTNRQDQQTFLTDIKPIAASLGSICIFDGIPGSSTWTDLTTGTGRAAIGAGNEPQFLEALLRLLRLNNLQYFVLLLDEFEKVPQLKRMTQQESKGYYDTLKMLIDAGGKELPFLYVLASNEDAWKIATSKDAALETRFFQRIELPSTVSDDVARHIIVGYLETARTNDARIEHELLPFPENFLQLLPPAYRGTPRQLMHFCYRLIELAADGTKDKVTESDIQKLVK